jgi:hypothetical protein
MGPVRSIELIVTEVGNHPSQDVVIVDCGEILEEEDDGYPTSLKTVILILIGRLI